jgi:hypothetical protein
LRGALRNFRGAPLDFSGAPLGFSGAPLGFSGAPLGFSGAPLGFSGVPLDFSGVPLDSSGAPLDSGGAPLDSGGAPLGLRSGLSEPDLNGGYFLLYVVGLGKAFVGQAAFRGGQALGFSDFAESAAFCEKKAAGLLTLFLKFRILVNVCGNWAFR